MRHEADDREGKDRQPIDCRRRSTEKPAGRRGGAPAQAMVSAAIVGLEPPSVAILRSRKLFGQTSVILFSRRPLGVIGTVFERSTMSRTLRLTLALAAWRCLPSAAAFAATSRSHASDTFVFGTEGDPVLLDGALVSDGPSGRAVAQMFEGLVGLKAGTTKVIPLARDELDDVEERSLLDVQPPQGREVPGRDARSTPSPSASTSTATSTCRATCRVRPRTTTG